MEFQTQQLLFHRYILSTPLCHSTCKNPLALWWQKKTLTTLPKTFQYHLTIQKLNVVQRNPLPALAGMLCPPRAGDPISPSNIPAGISPGNTITHLKYLTQGLDSASDSTACWWAIRNKHCYVTFKTWQMSSRINDSFNGFRYTGPSPASALRSYWWPGLNWVSLFGSFEKPLWSKPVTGFIIRMLWNFLCRKQK